MHRLTVTITASNAIEYRAALEAFATHLENVADDLIALPPQNHSFGAFGEAGCKVYYRVELDDPGTRQAETSVVDAAAR